MKIAVLILAHKNLGQLRRLIDHLKPDFNIYIHINKNTGHNFADEPGVTFITERYAPYWGSDETPKAMLALLKESYKDGCDYFMIISGQDLPLMRNRDMIRLIEDDPVNYIYHHPVPKPSWNHNGGVDRIALYWPKKIDRKTLPGKAIGLATDVLFLLVRKWQLLTGWKRPVRFELWGGSMWLNINRGAATHILNFIRNNPGYTRHFRFTRLSDEIFFHSILFATGYKDASRVVNDDMRLIDWESGPEYPRIMTNADFHRLITSGKFFGRKFDENVDSDIINRILTSLS